MTRTLRSSSTLADALRQRITDVVAIEEQALEPILVALFARGHALIEGIPGIGKTLLARTLARCVDCDFHRVQFTNDLMPSDVVGSLVWRGSTEQFEFVRGPLFANIVLADEINRTSPRTLSCLLEAMESGRVSVEGRSLELPDPFLVLATRNGIEFHGTFPVPEAALDRFLVRVELDYPEAERELALYLGADPEDRLRAMRPVVDHDELRAILDRVRRVEVREAVARYALAVVQATREHEQMELGASPRAAMAWIHAARARAVLHGRDYVLPDDLKLLAQAVLSHRLFAREGADVATLLDSIVQSRAVEL